jgi:GTPase SAR1 family protein
MSHPSFPEPSSKQVQFPSVPDSEFGIRIASPEKAATFSKPQTITSYRKGRMNDREELLKILVIGESAVGKTCLVLRYTDKWNGGPSQISEGVDFKTRDIEIEGVRVQLQIWDTAGQEKFGAIPKVYYRGAHAILGVFDEGIAVEIGGVNMFELARHRLGGQ